MSRAGSDPLSEPAQQAASVRPVLLHALRRGFLAFLVAALLGQAIALAGAVLSGVSASMLTEVGWLYFLAFHRVGLQLGFTDGVARILGSGPVVNFRVEAALLLGTALAAALLYRAGRAVAARVGGGGSLARAWRGAMVAPAYAVPVFLVSLVVSIDLSPDNALLPGLTAVRPVTWQALAFPIGLAAAAGAAGGLASAPDLAGPWGRRAAGWFAGGWRMFWYGLVLAFVGLLVLAVLRPEGAASYFRAVIEPGPKPAALLLGHHALLLPNQSLFILAPAMGACDGVYGAGVSADLLCYGRVPSVEDPVAVAAFAGELVRGGGAGSAPTAPMPAAYYLFLLVPFLATVTGSWWASGRWARGIGEAVVLGTGAGAVYALLVTIGSIAAGVTVGLSGGPPGSGVSGSVTLGPHVPSTALLALAWGVVMGAAGGWLGGRFQKGAKREADT